MTTAVDLPPYRRSRAFAPSKLAKLDPTLDPLGRCGTRPGYKAHEHRNERPCEPCSFADWAYSYVRRMDPGRREAERSRAAIRARSPEARAAARAYRQIPEVRASARESHRARRESPEGQAAQRAAYEAKVERLRARTVAEAAADFRRLRPAGKTCADCRRVLPEAAFSPSLDRADGRHRRCHQCDAARSRLRANRTQLHQHWSSRGICPATCIYCGGPSAEVDHVLPGALGGTHDLANLAPSCAADNASKRDRHPAEWLAEEHPDRLRAVTELYPHIAGTDPKEAA